MNNSLALGDMGCSVEPCGATESVLHYPCIVVALIVWRETLLTVDY
jgi:hypothetical protein